jgi:hypothetical protein
MPDTEYDSVLKTLKTKPEEIPPKFNHDHFSGLNLASFAISSRLKTGLSGAKS